MQLLFSLCVLALVLSACSSTTVVSRNERPTQPTDSASTSETDTTLDTGDDSEMSEPDATPDLDDAETDPDLAADIDNENSAAEDERGGRDEGEPLTPRQLEEAEGFGLGGAEQLSSLEGDCESGSDMACDILFEISGFDSPEEATALACGGRSDGTAIFCTPGINAIAGELVFDPASEGLDEIVTLCRGGDYTACDFLYFRSPFESEFEEIGGTCGDRVQVAVPDCRTFLADAG